MPFLLTCVLPFTRLCRQTSANHTPLRLRSGWKCSHCLQLQTGVVILPQPHNTKDEFQDGIGSAWFTSSLFQVAFQKEDSVRRWEDLCHRLAHPGGQSRRGRMEHHACEQVSPLAGKICHAVMHTFYCVCIIYIYIGGRGSY